MQKVAKFEKVSFSQFKTDWQSAFGSEIGNLQEVYDSIKLPMRATEQSAGYDFFSPIDIILPPKTQMLVPTGVRVKMKNGTFLAIFPRSGLGFKFRLQLNNTVGIIDADYYNADNEGHIMIKIFNDSVEQKTVEVLAGTGLAQGIFLPFGITQNDVSATKRTGGFGSTTQ